MISKSNYGGIETTTVYELNYGDIISATIGDVGGYKHTGYVLASTPKTIIMKLDPNRSGRINDDGWECALDTPSIVELEKAYLANCHVDAFYYSQAEKNDYISYVNKAAKLHDEALCKLALNEIGDQTYGGKNLVDTSKYDKEAFNELLSEDNISIVCPEGSIYE